MKVMGIGHRRHTDWESIEQERLSEYEEVTKRGHALTPEEAIKFQEKLLEIYYKKPPEERTKQQQKEFLNTLVKESDVVPVHAQFEVIESLLADMYEYGPVQELFETEDVTDIQIYIPFNDDEKQRVLITRRGKRYWFTNSRFRNRTHAQSWLNNKLARIGDRFDPASYTANGMMPDNSRIHVGAGPFGYSTWDPIRKEFKLVRCMIITLRRFTGFFTPEQLVESGLATSEKPAIFHTQQSRFKPQEKWLKHQNGAIDQATLDFLRIMVILSLNFLVAGGTGAGKTTWANALTKYIPGPNLEDWRSAGDELPPPGQIMLIIEEAAELQPQVPHAIRVWESKPNVIGGLNEFTQSDALKEALRMFPDRVFIAELRDKIAYEFLKAIQNGHDGSFTTIHASDCASALRQTTVFAKSHPDMPSEEYITTVIRERLHCVVHLENDKSQDKRYVDEIVEVIPTPDSQYTTHTVLKYESGVDENGQSIGYFHFIGPSERFLDMMREKNIPIPESWR